MQDGGHVTDIVLSSAEEAAIRNVLASVAYLLDARQYDRLGDVFSEDIHFENPSRLIADGLPALIEAMTAISEPALSHHITNVIVDLQADGTAACISKALTLRKTGVHAAEYRDVVRRDGDGWRICSRKIRSLG